MAKYAQFSYTELLLCLLPIRLRGQEIPYEWA